MTMFAALNGLRALPGTMLQIPAWGIPYADVVLDGDHELAKGTPVKLTLSDLVVSGTVLTSGTDTTRTFVRMVGGHGGWGKVLKAKGYNNDSGVKLGTLLKDAASECGETLSYTGSEKVGSHYSRNEDRAGAMLEKLVSKKWFVDVDGVTKVEERKSAPIEVKYSRERIDRARATVTIAAESIASIMPGVTVEGLKALDVAHELSESGLRTHIWGSTSGTVTSRSLAAFKAMLELLDPARNYRGNWEYRIVAPEGNKLSLQPVRVSSGMPDLRRVEYRPSVPGVKADFLPGAKVMVAFADCDPSRPFVFALSSAEDPGFKAINLTIDSNVLIKLGLGTRPAIGAGDFAGPFPVAPTQPKVLI